MPKINQKIREKWNREDMAVDRKSQPHCIGGRITDTTVATNSPNNATIDRKKHEKYIIYLHLSF